MSMEHPAGRFGETVSPEDRAGEEANTTSDPLIGRTLEGRFEIRERMGEGGMGTVYRAYQSSIDREVAIKVVRPENGAKPIAVKRFMREAKLASQVSHPSLVVIHDFGHTFDGLLFLVMELVEGRTLQEELCSGEGMELERFLRIGEQLCSALSAAHQKGIVHRDIKPSNIMLVTSGSRDMVKVLDFGLAKSTTARDVRLTKSKQKVGTPLYMAPEMIRAEASDARSDLYQLGCTLYEMAAGAPPFSAKTVDMLFIMHLEHEPPQLAREGLGPLQSAIMSMLAKDPQQRPQTVEEVRGLFDQCLTEYLSKASRPIESRRGLAIGGVVTALVAAGAVVLMSSRRGKSEESTASTIIEAPSAAVPQVESAPASKAPIVEAASREVLLTSSPEATILRDSEVIGKTPMRYMVDVNQGATLEFRAVGYESKTQTVDASSEAALDVVLEKIATTRRSKKRRKPAGTKQDPGNTTPKPASETPSREEEFTPIFRLKK